MSDETNKPDGMLTTVKKELKKKPMLSLDATVDYLIGRHNNLHNKLDDGDATLYNAMPHEEDGINYQNQPFKKSVFRKYDMSSIPTDTKENQEERKINAARRALIEIQNKVGISKPVLKRYLEKNYPALLDENLEPDLRSNNERAIHDAKKLGKNVIDSNWGYKPTEMSTEYAEQITPPSAEENWTSPNLRVNWGDKPQP